MLSKNKIILTTVLLIAVLILSAKPYFNHEKTNDFLNLETLNEKFDYIKKEKPVTLIVLSYDADCCESTMAFFARYNENIQDIIQHSSEDLYTLYIDYAALTDEDELSFNTLVEMYNLKTLPSLVLIDRRGKILVKIEGPFDKEDLLRQIKEAL